MSANKDNPDIVALVDYATGKSFLRLHLDIEIPKEQFRNLLDLMDEKKYNEALSMMEKCQYECSDYLKLFFGKRLLVKE